MLFLIPSYKRGSKLLQTVQMLRNFGLGREHIIVSTQTESDYDEYNRTMSEECTIIYREGSNVAMNRNTLLQYMQKNGETTAWMLDDDIKEIDVVVTEKKSRALTKSEFFATLGYLRDFCCGNNISLCGIYPIANPLFAQGKDKLDTTLIGTVLGIFDNTLRFDEEYAIKEDFELCLRIISQGGHTLRKSRLFAKAGHKTKGGCEEHWEKDEKYTLKLIEQYPHLVKYSKGRKSHIKLLF